MRGIKEIVEKQKKIHPSMEKDDILKLLYQITHGPSHILNNKHEAYRELFMEWSMSKLSVIDEPLMEEIDPLNVWVRLNIRVASKHLKPEDIFTLLLLSAMEKPQPDRFEEYLKEFHIEKRDDIPHHSMEYKEEKPSYRIVKREELFKMIKFANHG